ncbi:Plasminogen activator inhibitor 1 RNA-binding [Homalodisca vitripennis]|nr:Plasminogen activator inhibitor 1 RNA-binding [Homalodisca vitripennis]
MLKHGAAAEDWPSQLLLFVQYSLVSGLTLDGLSTFVLMLNQQSIVVLRVGTQPLGATSTELLLNSNAGIATLKKALTTNIRETTEGQNGVDAAEEGETPAQIEEERKELTLDEWKALKGNRSKPQYNLRKAGEGEDLSQWKKMYALQKKKEEEEEEEEEVTVI